MLFRYYVCDAIYRFRVQLQRVLWLEFDTVALNSAAMDKSLNFTIFRNLNVLKSKLTFHVILKMPQKNIEDRVNKTERKILYF